MQKSRFVVLMLLMIAMVLPLAAVSAQSENSISITEQQINDSYRVTNPYRRAITEASVDLLDGQAEVSATITLRRQPPAAVVAVYEPAVVNGRVDWTLVSMTVDGETATDDYISRINTGLRDALRNTVRQHVGQGRYTVTDVSVSSDAVTISYTRP